MLREQLRRASVHRESRRPLIRESPEIALPEVRLFRAGQLRESKVSGWRQCLIGHPSRRPGKPASRR